MIDIYTKFDRVGETTGNEAAGWLITMKTRVPRETQQTGKHNSLTDGHKVQAT